MSEKNERNLLEDAKDAYDLATVIHCCGLEDKEYRLGKVGNGKLEEAIHYLHTAIYHLQSAHDDLDKLLDRRRGIEEEPSIDEELATAKEYQAVLERIAELRKQQPNDEEMEAVADHLGNLQALEERQYLYPNEQEIEEVANQVAGLQVIEELA